MSKECIHFLGPLCIGWIFCVKFSGNTDVTGSEKGERWCGEILRWLRGEIEVSFFFIEMEDGVA